MASTATTATALSYLERLREFRPIRERRLATRPTGRFLPVETLGSTSLSATALNSSQSLSRQSSGPRALNRMGKVTPFLAPMPASLKCPRCQVRSNSQCALFPSPRGHPDPVPMASRWTAICSGTAAVVSCAAWTPMAPRSSDKRAACRTANCRSSSKMAPEIFGFARAMREFS